MSDGRKNNGGARPGSGRKSKAEILGFAALIDSVWEPEEQKKVLRKLATDCNDIDFQIRHESRKLLLAYKWGKPTEKLEVSGAEGKDLFATFEIKTRQPIS